MTTLLYQIDERGIAHITLDRPEVHNAFNENLIAELKDAFLDVASSTRVRAVILQGNGSSFCAGADLDWMKRAAHFDEAHNLADAQALSDMLSAIDSCPKPVIAAVHGPAYGGGVGLVACADIAIATQRAKFMLSEVRLGLTPATISPFVIRAIGARQARRYFLTAEAFDASTALSLGLVHEVVAEPADMTKRLDELVSILLGNAPGALTDAKALIQDLAAKPITGELRVETAKRIARRRATPEAKEGIAAFLEKRRASWVH